MFSFHKPKIYRSVHGCCICRAKSSSSRFTDSKKYETDFEKCFRILETRAGEICNACVLLVKRWKKLPSGTNRHWHHVVDARAGPGTKSTLKLKSRLPLKHKHRSLKKKKRVLDVHVDRIPSPRPVSADLTAFEDSLDRTEAFSYSQSSLHSPSISEEDSDNEDSRHVTQHKHSLRKGSYKRGSKLHISSFLDLTYWKKTEVCCGIIFKGPNGEVLVDPQLLSPCRACRQSKSSSGGPPPIIRSPSTDTESNSNQSYPCPDDAELDIDPDDDLSMETPARSVPSAFSLPQLQCSTQQMGSLQQRVLSMEC